ncbi:MULTISPECIES: carbamoyltransferase C-terminal domain-containing protein [unclassified Streptomyces]|uniref:carbamoyltransferase C-terminal domain-containing protein n=1 Tax=unclassified Streptomyces TaxID=2593676 RepID=UPI003825338C
MSTPYAWDDLLIPPQARGGRVTLNLNDELAAYLPKRPAAYLRISSDRFGIEAGVDRQAEDAEDTRARLRWRPFAKIYKENDTSAFKKRKVMRANGTIDWVVIRPKFRELLSDLAAGTIDGVIFCDLEHLVRQPRDLEDLIDIVEYVKRPVIGATGGRMNLINDSDRHMARRLCVGGGVATNCVSIGRIIEAGIFDEVFVPPAPGDAGTAIGAALAVHVDGRSPRPVAGVARACYLGPSYEDQPLDLTPWPGLRQKTLCIETAEFLADELAHGTIVGLFQGAVEAGPRALGNRSILASPLEPGVVERLNATVKFRESFRLFAPMVLAECAAEFFTLGQQAPYMSMASGVTNRTRERVPAIVHANGTSRLQTVTREQNPFMHAVLTAFGRRTGVPMLINTSLNVKGKPICGTPEMALECLSNSGLDALLLEGRWITK